MELSLVSRLSLARHRATMRSDGHEHHVAILLTEGTALFECDGRIEVTAPSLYFVPARTPHRLLDGSEVAGWGFAGLTVPLEQRPANLAVPLSAAGARQLGTWLAGIERESAGSEPYRHAAIDALRVLANVEIARVWRPASSHLIAAATGAIAALARDPVKPRDIARAVGVTPAHLSHEMTRLTGKTVTQWIAEARVARVQERLVGSDRTLAEIAEELNYSDATQLAREFRRVCGIAPGAWRAKSA
ncbi:MAG TPA: helix-turn-helix domain-containing protein [Thermoanaerobaculia bacterium]|nr:helix-turn-helix domain-containing protein [Thermoanaerobaculia bacterium]